MVIEIRIIKEPCVANAKAKASEKDKLSYLPVMASHTTIHALPKLA